MTKIIIIPGSTRNGSVNVQLGEAIRLKLQEMGAEADLVSLADYPMPIFNADDEAQNGVPKEAKDLADLVGGYQGVVLINPEYNASLAPLLKNTLDWFSRDVGVKVYQDRVFALAACSPGALGGIRGLSHVRDILVSVVADTITPQLAVGDAGGAFAEDGSLKNERAVAMLETMCETLIKKTRHLAD
jgi:NAD(P)H-dependent FMN reductase